MIVFDRLQDTMDKRDSHILERILRHEISDDALRVYEQVRGNADMTQLVCKLLSMVLEDSKVLGPNKIGLDKRDLHLLQSQLDTKKTDKDYKSTRGRRGVSTERKDSKKGGIHKKSKSQNASKLVKKSPKRKK